MSSAILEMPPGPPYSDLPGPILIPQRNSAGRFSSFTTDTLAEIYDKIWELRDKFEEIKSSDLSIEDKEERRNRLLPLYQTLLDKMMKANQQKYEYFKSLRKIS